MKAHDFDQALELRGQEFKEMLDGFVATSSLAVKESWLPKDKASVSFPSAQSRTANDVRHM